MNRQNQWLFEAPFTQPLTNRSLSMPQHEADAMAGRLRGRSSSGVELVRMYHYSPNVIRDAVKQFSKWTDIGFGGKSIQAVARITGLQLDKIKYRYELILPREDRERYFRNIATKMLPGLGAASEYISQIPIPINWIQQVIKMSKP